MATMKGIPIIVLDQLYKSFISILKINFTPNSELYSKYLNTAY